MNELIDKLCKELPILYSRGVFYTTDTRRVQEIVEIGDDCCLEVDQIQKYLGSKDYEDNEKTILGVPRERLIREEDRNFVIYRLPLNEKTYEYYKKRLCRMLGVKEKKEEN